MIAARHDGTTPRPLLTFHGTGGDEHQFHELGQRLAPGAHVISPRGAVMEGAAARYFRRTAEGVYDMADLAARTDEMAAFIGSERDRTGATEVWAFGYSNGANILASVLFAVPGLIQRAGLLHPLIPFDPAHADLTGTTALVTAGRRDPICPAPLTERLIAALGARGATVETVWHDGGHEIAPHEVAALSRLFG